MSDKVRRDGSGPRWQDNFGQLTKAPGFEKGVEMLAFCSARNDIIDSSAAMRDCIERARAQIDGGSCDLIVFYTTMGHDFRSLVGEAQRLCPEADLVGCTCHGVIGSDGASERMRALSIMAIRGRGEFAVAHADSVRGANSRDVAKAVAADLREKNPRIGMVNIIASGIDIAGDRAIEGIESVFGPKVPIFGGTSGDNMRAKVSYQFVGERILERGLLLVGYADPTLELITAVHHGSVPIGKPFEVTRAEGNRIDELDGQPAWPRLMDTLGLDVSVDVGETLPVAGLGQQMPDALREAYGNEHFIHTIFLVDDERRSFFLPATVETGTKLWLMRRDEELIFAGTERMVGEITDELAGAVPAAVFHTDCAARGRLMFNRVLKDEIITRIQVPICQGQQVPWLGSYGFGEFTPVAGHNRFHTQTSSLYALVRRS